MKQYKMFLISGLFGLMIVALVSVMGVFAADEVTIQGTINEAGQVVTDNGEIYAIAFDDLGMEVMGKIDQYLELVGTVEEREGEKTFTIKLYREPQEKEAAPAGEGG